MDDLRAGRILRMLRRRRGWRQIDVAIRASVSQQTISLIERGHLDRLSIQTVRRVFAVVEASFIIDIRWRGADLDRLLDDDHASLVGQAVQRVGRAGWQTAVEVTYSRFGERGSIDILGWRPVERAALMVEVKASVGAAEETIRRADAKARLLTEIVRERLGWRPAVVGRLLIVADASTSRRRIARHASVFGAAFPDTRQAVDEWLAAPVGSMSGLIFLSSTHGGGVDSPKRGRDRVRRSRRPPE
jgi:transcriptional regulator with XRE-family HTH domain